MPKRPIAPPQATLTSFEPPAARVVDANTVAFLSELKGVVVAAADKELVGTDWTAEHCPWIDYWFSYYSARSLADIHAALRKFVPGVGDVTSIANVREPLTARVRSGIQRWRNTGEIDAPTTGDARDAELVARTASLRGGEPVQAPEAVSSILGAPADVRIHTSAAASALAKQAGALAYTIGSDIVYSESAPRPGTIQGDALLAHELAHTRQQARETDGAAGSRTAETNADGAVVHAAARKLGLRGAVGSAWRAVAAPLGLQRCSEKESHDAEIAADKQELDSVQTIIGSSTSFANVAAAITKREALEHWIAALSGEHGKRTGTSAPEPGVPGCNCTTYVTVVLKEAFEKVGRKADWTKVIKKTHKLTGSQDTNGVELQRALQSELGWKAVYWAPDPTYDHYQRRPHDYDHAPPGTTFVKDTENKETFAHATRKKNPTYELHPGKPSDEDIRISQAVFNYAPAVAGSSPFIGGLDSTTPKDMTGYNKLARIPFGVLTAKTGFHMAIIVEGVVYEIHWSEHSNSAHLYARTPLEAWGWGSGVIVAPAEDVDKAFK
ncbi:MAG: DUF4157 domain-containing protein [Kofleriaceae bacterium]